MKKITVILPLILSFCLAFLPAEGAVVHAAAAQPSAAVPQVTAETAIVADAQTGLILYQKNMHQKMYPASLTKILTGLVAVEHSSQDEKLTVSQSVFDSVPRDTANIALLPGEQITMDEALHTMFIASANDSAAAIADHVGGTIPTFVLMMNQTAREIGAVDSHFANPNGLPDPNNLTSAYDLALITRKALQSPAMMTYFGAKSYIMPATNLRPQVGYLTLHKMMKNTRYHDADVIAGKTGWETMSGHTLATVAQKNGRTLICIVMKSADGSAVYTDTQALLGYGFSITEPQGTPAYLTEPAARTQVVLSASIQKTKRQAADFRLHRNSVPLAAPGLAAAALLLCAVAVPVFVHKRRKGKTG
jgi:D-alanyl-D-alanine carboxypeptidase (penicillin-binding protein 5/6)